MEIAVDPAIPTYTVVWKCWPAICFDRRQISKSPSLPSRFCTEKDSRQTLDSNGQQREIAEEWDSAQRLQKLGSAACITLEARRVKISAWRFDIQGISGHVVPVYFLDTDLPENHTLDRCLTDYLHGAITNIVYVKKPSSAWEDSKRWERCSTVK